MKSWRRAALPVSLAVMIAGSASAEPGLWQRTRDPEAAKAYRLLVLGERARVPASEVFDSSAMGELLSQRAVVMLQLAGAEQLADPRLDLFLGSAMVAAGDEYQEPGRRLLLRSLKRDPDAPDRSQAWFAVAIASSKLRDHETELEAYTLALRAEWVPEARATIFMNRGESRMAVGDLEAAMQDYRQALALAQEPELTALARWGLAVALERDADLPGALAMARRAISVGLGPPDNPLWAIDLPSVFFTPPYEVHYYRALGLMAQALDAEEPALRARILLEAARLWTAYLNQAVEDESARWVDRAELNLDWCLNRSRKERSR